MEGYLATILSAIPQNSPVIINELPPTDVNTNTNSNNIETTTINWLNSNWMPVIAIIIIGGVLFYLIAKK